jgi:hypothetical protein
MAKKARPKARKPQGYRWGPGKNDVTPGYKDTKPKAKPSSGRITTGQGMDERAGRGGGRRLIPGGVGRGGKVTTNPVKRGGLSPKPGGAPRRVPGPGPGGTGGGLPITPGIGPVARPADGGYRNPGTGGIANQPVSRLVPRPADGAAGGIRNPGKVMGIKSSTAKKPPTPTRGIPGGSKPKTSLKKATRRY